LLATGLTYYVPLTRNRTTTYRKLHIIQELCKLNPHESMRICRNTYTTCCD